MSHVPSVSSSWPMDSEDSPAHPPLEGDICWGPGGCPLLLKWPLPLLPPGFLFVPESRSHLSLELFVMFVQEDQRDLGALPLCLAARERSDLGT